MFGLGTICGDSGADTEEGEACEKKNVSFDGDNSDGRISGVFLFIGSQGPQRGGRNMDRPGGVCRTG